MAGESFEKISGKHADHFKLYAAGGEREKLAQSWVMKGTLAEQTLLLRHSVSDPLLEYSPEASWLTIGDGRYGSDAQYLTGKGANALASDISEYLLKEAKEKGYISDYKVINAEQIDLPDQSFDYILCKEAYHHCPRPMKALYEMLRVARKGVLLLEPPDQYIFSSAIQIIFRKILHFCNTLGITKLLLNRQIQKHTYEDVGNYVYKISVREMEKVALGMNYPLIAYKPINYVGIKGMDKTPSGKKNSIYYKTKMLVALLNILTYFRLIEPMLLSIIIMKETDHKLITILKKHKYTIGLLPSNPNL